MSALSDHFERICVLNLQYKENRKARLKRHLNEVGLADKILWVKALSGDKMPPPAWWNAGNGAWGCLLSHSKVITDALEDNVSSLLIMEDDVVFQQNAAELFKHFMAQVPDDWGQLYLGGQHLHKPVIIEDNGFVCRVRCVNRTHAYAINRDAMTRLFQHIWHAPDYIKNPNGWHFDHQLGVAHEREDWKSYAPRWWIAGQDEDWSNISGRHNPRLWWQSSEWALHLPFVIIPSAIGSNLGDDNRLLHCGNHLIPGTSQDEGLDSALTSNRDLYRWLEMIATEAMQLGKLPALQHPDLHADRIKKLWKAGILPWIPRGMKQIVTDAYSNLDSVALQLARCHSETLPKS